MTKTLRTTVALAIAVTAIWWTGTRDPLEGAAAGVGERLLLVVADSLPQQDAVVRRAALDARFGALDGFSVDATSAYRVEAVLVQTSADVVRRTCPSAGGVVAFGTQAVECAEGTAGVDILQPVRLKRLAIDDARTSDDPSCGRVGHPPCQTEKLRRLLDARDSLRAPRTLVATGFRTKVGAEQFIELARSVGIGGLLTLQVVKTGGSDIGLGQEPHPNGSGPLLGPLPDQAAYQR